MKYIRNILAKLHLFFVKYNIFLKNRQEIKRQLEELERESKEYHNNNFKQQKIYYKQKKFGKMIELVGEGTKYVLNTIDKREKIKEGLLLFK